MIAQIGTGGGQGYVLEYRGNVIENLSMEARMTICNMSIEAGARAGMIAPDETTFAYLKGRDHAPAGGRLGRGRRRLGARCAPTTTPCSTPRCDIDADALTPFVTWGTNPGQGLPLGEQRARTRPRSSTRTSGVAAEKALAYMGLTAGTPLREIARRHRVRRLLHQRPDRGPARRRRASSTAARVADGVRMLVVPGSMRVRFQAEDEGLDKVFTAAGAEWRSAGCSMCLGMNPDQLAPGERSASTSQPQLRGPPGQGRPHPPRLAARRRGHRGARHASAHPEDLD